MIRASRLVADILRNRRRKDGRPRFLTHTVTFGCNARCVMCDSWKKPTDDDLTIDEIAAIYAQLPRMDAVRLTGGEPFVRKDLGQIADLAAEHLRPGFVHITTNGFLTDRITTFCDEYSQVVPLRILVSIDGVGDKHNAIRGSTLAWRNAFRTVETLAQRREKLDLELSVNQTIVDRDGVEQYHRLRELLDPLDVRLQVVIAYDESATYSVERDAVLAPESIGGFKTYGQLGDRDIDELVSACETDLRHWPLADRLAKRYYLRGIRNRLIDGAGKPNPRCVALSSHLRLFPNGDVPTCQFNTKTIGNLRERGFDEVWFGETHRRQRDWVNACAGCWAECEVLPSAIYTGDIVRAAFDRHAANAAGN